jgi:hypothetical protein
MKKKKSNYYEFGEEEEEDVAGWLRISKTKTIILPAKLF